MRWAYVVPFRVVQTVCMHMYDNPDVGLVELKGGKGSLERPAAQRPFGIPPVMWIKVTEEIPSERHASVERGACVDGK